MNVGVAPFQWNWVQITPGDYEAQGEHYYYRVKRNEVLKKWALGRKADPLKPIQLTGFYPTLKDAKAAAEADGAAL